MSQPERTPTPDDIAAAFKRVGEGFTATVGLIIRAYGSAFREFAAQLRDLLPDVMPDDPEELDQWLRERAGRRPQ